MSKRRRNTISQLTPRTPSAAPQTRGAVALAENNIGGSPYPGNMGPNQGHNPVNMATSTNTPPLSLQWPNITPSGHPYPEMPNVSETKPNLDSLGATGTAIFSGIITSEEYNPDFFWRDGIKIYEQMVRSEAQVFAVRQLLELPIRRTPATIQPFNDSPQAKEIASFVESCLFHDMKYQTSDGGVLCQTWDDTLRQILMAISYGFMLFEKVFRVEDGWVKWARWTPLLPRTVWRWWVGADNELVGIQQWTFKDYSYQFVNIPYGKLLCFIHRQEGNNYEGTSVLRTAYKNWWYKQNLEKIDAIAIERNAVVPPTITMPENFTSNDIAAAQKIVQNIRANEMGGVVLPHDFILEFPKNMQKYAAQSLPSIQYHDVMIARNVLAQFVNLGSTETGAYALDASQKATFLSALQAECEWIEDVINHAAIQQLVDYNFENVEGYPKLKFGKVLADDFDKISNALQQLGTAGFLHPTPETEDMLRDMLGLPAAPVSEVTATNPTAPTTPQRPENANANDHGDQEATNKSGVSEAAGYAQAGAALSIVEETRLLREALDAVRGVDAVERGLLFYNPNHSPVNGEFSSGGAGGESGAGGGRGRSGGRTKAPAKSAEEKRAVRRERELTKARAEVSHHEAEAQRIAEGRRAGDTERFRNADIQAHLANASAAREKVARLEQRQRDEQSSKGTSSHEEKVARAEAAVQKARARSDAAEAAYKAAFGGAHGEIYGTSGERIAAARAQRSAETRLANLKKEQEAGKSEGESTASIRRGRSAQPKGENEATAAAGGRGSLPREVRPGEELHAIAHDNTHEINFAASLDVAHLRDTYGEHQLGAALSQFRSRERIDEAAASVGLTRKSGESNAALVSRITSHATEGRYHADFGSHSSTSTARSSTGETIHERSARLQREGGLQRETQAGEKLSPIRTDLPWRPIDPTKTPDPQFLITVYGEHQLGRAVNEYHMPILRRIAAEQGVPSSHSKAELVSRITSHVTGGRYSANFGHAAESTGRGAKSKDDLQAELERLQGRESHLLGVMHRTESRTEAEKGRSSDWFNAQHGRTLTRIANIQSQLASSGGIRDRSSEFESKIAGARSRLAKLESDYAAHKQKLAKSRGLSEADADDVGEDARSEWLLVQIERAQTELDALLMAEGEAEE